ncbi:hypothetical protein E2C01_014213 [Portunus trituberculatus]|uniref:Uncharacterized protein n=1 Tax=Portunus trituberculatus TaxID=210409 RepID=A0A5B7DJA9_PORTR|nr:hypothetical protein [Portunus trituberculatus]
MQAPRRQLTALRVGQDLVPRSVAWCPAYWWTRLSSVLRHSWHGLAVLGIKVFDTSCRRKVFLRRHGDGKGEKKWRWSCSAVSRCHPGPFSLPHPPLFISCLFPPPSSPPGPLGYGNDLPSPSEASCRVRNEKKKEANGLCDLWCSADTDAVMRLRLRCLCWMHFRSSPQDDVCTVLWGGSAAFSCARPLKDSTEWWRHPITSVGDGGHSSGVWDAPPATLITVRCYPSYWPERGGSFRSVLLILPGDPSDFQVGLFFGLLALLSLSDVFFSSQGL